MLLLWWTGVCSTPFLHLHILISHLLIDLVIVKCLLSELVENAWGAHQLRTHRAIYIDAEHERGCGDLRRFELEVSGAEQDASEQFSSETTNSSCAV